MVVVESRGELVYEKNLYKRKSPHREVVYPKVRNGFTMKPIKFVSGSFTFKRPLQGLVAWFSLGTHGGSDNPSLIYWGSSLFLKVIMVLPSKMHFPFNSQQQAILSLWSNHMMHAAQALIPK